MKIELYPKEKVTFDGRALSFGMSREDAEVLLGTGVPVGDRVYYFQNEVAVSYGVNGVEFVEFLGGLDGCLKLSVYGASVFETEAEALVALLREKNGAAKERTENGFGYTFYGLGVGLYREAIPEDVEEMIREAASFGNPMSDEEIAYEMAKANRFATIGIAAPEYYK